MLSECRADIVIPVFNDPTGLADCLASLESQVKLVPNLGVIVVDNGSEPPVTIEPRYPFPVSLIKCLTPGSYAARNTGASLSDAEFLVFLDADCVAQEDWLAHGILALLNGCCERVVGGEVLFLPSEKPTAVEAYQRIVGFGQDKNINSRGFTATANLFVKRQVFLRIGDFDETLLSGGDREWCWRAAMAGIPVIFEKSAIVLTQPRVKLSSAIVQARRIAGGRYSLLSDRDNRDIDIKRVLPEPSALEKLKVVLRGSEFGLFMRLRVLGVAVVLLLARKLEVLRLNVGGNKERR